MDFQRPYNRNRFLEFLENFLPDDFDVAEEDVPPHRTYSKIKKVRRLGKVGSLEAGGQPLKVYEVEHESEHDPRVSLTRDFFGVMRDDLTTRALIIFYSPKSENYRFSLMTVDFTLDGKKVAKEYSNPRRFSFFLGPEAKIYTPTKYLAQKGKVEDFDDLISRFDIEVVTKEFFREISNWYFWAVQNSIFPKDAQAQNNGKNIAVIRLITRLIFIWFMKQKRLVPNYLFEQKELENLLNDLSDENDSYYKAILQNLFFATLNTPVDKRRFREKPNYHGVNKDYGDKSIYRYEEDFKNSDSVAELFKGIPFLNGGLFECLDRKEEKIVIDGFTRIQKNQPRVPNFLFFSSERVIDLNKEYGTKNKKHKVRGLIHILNTYNFTIDESTPIDIEISLDPELLGRVFENLLASYNPETSTTARKSTGSYYTPREIVDYMVTESLKVYFKTHFESVENVDDKLENLFSTASEENPFDAEQSKKLVGLIESIKIVDPAVGSGAFPMGVLNKLVFILNKVDHGNQLWKYAQIKAAYTIPDQNLKTKTIKEIEDYFYTKKPDYWRKLYLIQRCIYGVDIQQIAVEIAKLRFFISLLVDEDKNDIQPLPNLDFKIVCGNSLQSVQTEDLFGDYNKKRLEELKERLFFEPDHDNKKVIKFEIDRIFNEFTDNKRLFDFELYFSEAFNKNGSQDVGFDIVLANPPYIGEKGHKKFFQEVKNYKLGRFYFGKMDYFYFFFHLALNISKKDAQVAFVTTNYYPTAMGARKLRQDFKKRAIIRRLIDFNELKIFEAALGQHNMITVLQKGQNENAITKTATTQRQGVAKHEILRQILRWEDPETTYYNIKQKDLYDGEEGYIRLGGNSGVSENPIQKILEKVKQQGEQLDLVCNVNQGVVTGADKVSRKHLEKYGIKANVSDGIFVLTTDEINKLDLNGDKFKILKPWFKNSDIQKWTTQTSTKEKVIYSNAETVENINNFPNLKNHLEKFKKITSVYAYRWHDLHRSRESKIFEGEKIVAPQRSSTNTFGYNEIPWYASADVYFITGKDKFMPLRYILALLNSSLYYLWLYHRGKRKGETLELYQKPLSEIPIKKIPGNKQRPFIDLVDKILAITKSSDYLENSAKKKEVEEYEKQIDEMVYELYGLTEEEIKIIEGT